VNVYKHVYNLKKMFHS